MLASLFIVITLTISDDYVDSLTRPANSICISIITLQRISHRHINISIKANFTMVVECVNKIDIMYIRLTAALGEVSQEALLK